VTMPPEGVPAEPPDADAIDAQFQQLQAAARQLEGQVDRLGQMMRQAALGGDSTAQVWLSEFRLIAVQIKAEQAQMHSLLQAMHSLTAYALHQAEEAYASAGWDVEQGGSPQPDEGAGPSSGQPAGGGGGEFAVGTLPGQPATAAGEGAYGQQPPAAGYRASSSSDWAAGVPDPSYDGPPDEQPHHRGASMLRKLGAGAAVAAGTLGILHVPGSGASRGSLGRQGGSGSPFQRRGGLFGNQAAARDDAVADDARGGQQGGGQLERFLRGNLGRSVRGRGDWGMQDHVIHRLW
jgi:hypothetical protein